MILPTKAAKKKRNVVVLKIVQLKHKNETHEAIKTESEKREWVFSTGARNYLINILHQALR